jgi:hypothetical protein
MIVQEGDDEPREIRKDVTLKSLISLMRKEYLREFNDSSRYKNLKRYRDQTFYEKCLQNYIKVFILNKKNIVLLKGTNIDRESLPK